MTNTPRQDSATSPTRRSSRSASRSASHGSRQSRRASTPAALKNFDWDSFDPAQYDPSKLENDDLNFGFGDYTVQGDNSNTQMFAPFNLLQNPLSAVPGAQGFDFGLENLEGVQPTWNQAALQYFPVRTVASISPTGRRKGKTPLQIAPVQTVASVSPTGRRSFVTAQTVAAVSPTGRRRSSRSASKAPVTYQYPEPVDPRDFDNRPYAFHGLDDEDDSLFLPETRASPHSPKRSRRLISEAVDDEDRGRKSPSHHSHKSKRSSHRSRSTRSSESEANPHKRKSVFDDTFKFEKPVGDTQKPWIRTNGTTKGLTTRTAKCNSYDPEQYYTYSRPPLGDWSTQRNEFHYTKHGELTDPTYTAEQIRDFILNYPEDKQNKIKLQLFIQVGPTDSARRYMSQSWAKCRFRECPVNVYEKGTILHGHYRVAFDERSYGTNNRYDPHLAASAYVHLYCMERFLDFEYICRKAHVYVDTRQYSTEPKGKFHATLSGRPECGIAQDFVKFAARGTLRENVKEFAHYPVHSDYQNGEAKPHEHTLTAHMHKVKADTRPAAQIRQFEERGLGPSHILVNKGDLEILMQEKKRRKEKAAKDNAKRKREQNLDIDTDEDDDGGNKSYMNKRRRLVDEAKSQYVVSKRQAPGRRNMQKERNPQPTQQGTQPQPWEVDDDEDTPDEHHLIPPRPHSARRSRRIAGQYVDYTELPNVMPEAPTGYIPAQGYYQTAPGGYYQPAPNGYYQTAPVGYYQPAPEGYDQPAPEGYDQPAPEDIHQPPPPQSPNSTQDRHPVYIDPALEDFDFDKFFEAGGLNRRSSSMTRFPPIRTSSILRARGSRSPAPRSATLRSAALKKSSVSFADHPVSSSHTFDTRAPPRDRSPRSPKRLTRSQLESPKKKARFV